MSARLRVLLIVTNLQGGGAEKAMIKFAAGLAGRGHDATLLLLERRIEHAVPQGVRLDTLARPDAPVGTGWIAKRRLAWRLAAWHRRAAVAGRFDLVVSTLPFADEVVRLAGLPRPWFRIANTVSAETGALAETDPRRARRRLRRLRRLYGGQRLIAVSEGVAGDLREQLAPPAARIEVVRNPFDLAAIRAQADAGDAPLPAGSYLVHAGRFDRQKRHDLLLAAFARAGLAQRLVLLTEPQPALTAMIEATGLAGRVTVAGFVPDPYRWFRHAAALVLCSDFEGMPNVLVEALACGVPVVSTDCPCGPREVLAGALSPDALGRLLVPCGDVEALAAAMRAVAAAPPAIGADAVARFAADASLDALERLAA